MSIDMTGNYSSSSLFRVYLLAQILVGRESRMSRSPQNVTSARCLGIVSMYVERGGGTYRV